MKRRSLIGAASALGAALALPRGVRAEVFPNRPLRYIVPVVAGGGSDLVGRTVCERWSKLLGQPIVVENLGGGGGVIACTTTMKAPADGYTLMQGYVATHGTSPATRKLNYDPVADFTPIGLIGATPNVLVVNPSVPANTLQEFIDFMRKNPGKLNYGSAGPGSLTHLTMELFKQQTGGFMVHIPYRGIAPAFTDLIGGQTQAMFPGLAAALPHLRASRVRPLALTGTKRHPLLPQVPTLIEAGLAGFDAQQWYGVVGPAAIPAPIVKQLNDTLAEVLGAPDMRDKLAVEAIEPMPQTSEQFGNYIRAEVARWTKLARDRHIELDNN